MKILSNCDLTNLNTFGVKARAKFLVEIHTESDFSELLTTPQFQNNEKLFLGGGSNILLTRDWDGIVVLNKLKSIEIVKENNASVSIRAMGGEVWQNLVEFAVERGYWGIENLASIPGSVGAAPVQNIGAYGAELKEVLESVEAFDIKTQEKKVFNIDNYTSGYRESIFKSEFKGRYFITAITIKLSKIPKKNLRYKSLKDYLEKNNINPDNPKVISQAVTEIRREKLPDPSVINNAGSFFKNVLVDQNKLDEMLKIYPEMPYFKTDVGIKIPSGWLIEGAGWKGKRLGQAGVYENHALVLVNHGNATGEEIRNLSQEIIKSVEAKFGLTLVPEVNLI